jgi:molybdenum cofactor cytidylyltransferase
MPETGQSGSVKQGVSAATGDSYLFISADQPKINPEDILPLLSAAKGNKDKIIFPVVDGKPHTPVIFPAGFRAELLKLTGDSGGRSIRDARPECCFPVEAEQGGNFVDIDNYADYCKYL